MVQTAGQHTIRLARCHVLNRMLTPIYLDHHATTPLDPRVLDAMRPALEDQFGNPASRQHLHGMQADLLVETAREELRDLLNASADEWDVVFTSGATEANNLALKGVAAHATAQSQPFRVVTAVTEHRAVLDPLAVIESGGVSVQRLPVGPEGQLQAETVERAIGDSPHTQLVSLMLANNEIGTIHDLRPIGEYTRARGIILHTDATQAVGHVPIDLATLPVDLLSLSAHKFHGPKGAGALLVRRAIRDRLIPQVHGGGQEGGLRAGTLNVPAIVGLGAAARIARQEMDAERERVTRLRDRLFTGLAKRLTSGVLLNGPTLDQTDSRLPHNLNVSFDYLDGSLLLPRISPRVAASSGSACTGSTASHVLTAIGRTSRQVTASLRFGLGRFTTERDIDGAVAAVCDVVEGLRRVDPLWELHCAGVDVSRILPEPGG